MEQFQYIPLKNGGKTLLLDTDIGPDCDDVGAIAVMAALAERYGVSVGAVVSCTSSPYGAPCAEALCRFAGLRVGAFAENKCPHLLDLERYRRYDRSIAERFGSPKCYPDSTETYRRTLAGLPDGSAVIVAIGPFSTLAQLLDSRPDEISPLDGVTLLRRKVSAVIAMAGKYPRGLEWNIEMEPVSARRFLGACPVPLILSDFDVGATIRCGFPTAPANASENPFWTAYRLWCGKDEGLPQLNKAYDLTAMHFAFEGVGEWFDLSETERLEVQEDGTTVFFPSRDGNCRRLLKAVPDRVLADYYNDVLLSVGAGEARDGCRPFAI